LAVGGGHLRERIIKACKTLKQTNVRVRALLTRPASGAFRPQTPAGKLEKKGGEGSLARYTHIAKLVRGVPAEVRQGRIRLTCSRTNDTISGKSGGRASV